MASTPPTAGHQTTSHQPHSITTNCTNRVPPSTGRLVPSFYQRSMATANCPPSTGQQVTSDQLTPP